MQKNPRPTPAPEELETLRAATLAAIAELAPPETPPIISTATLAKIAGIRPASIRSATHKRGHWSGLVPLKLGRTCLWKIAG